MAQEFKLKDLTSVDLKPGQKQEAEVEGVEGGKVLLLNMNGEIHATGPKCTHFGAPLVKGVFSGDGRLTCPWHGACFSVATGEVEDAPALDPIATFEVAQRDGGVYIKGDESALKASRGKLNIACTPSGPEKLVVIGGGSGTIGAVEGLRGGGFTGPITVLTIEPYQPIDRTKLSKALLADVSKVAWRSEDFYASAGITFVTDEAASVDFSAKSVATKSGATYDYTKLVLATGGVPRWLPLPGLREGELKNVFVLRSVPHVQAILQAVGEGKGKKAVVIGSSFIGMEVANCLAGKGCDVSVIGMESQPMERVLGVQIGKAVRGLLEKNGVKFYMGASVDKATASSSDASAVGAVHLKDGTALEADLVIEGVGVRPATDYLRDNPAVTLEKDSSVATDEGFAVPGVDGVFAVGDIATYPYHGPGGGGKPTRIEHWNVAQNAGRGVAAAINGKLPPGKKGKPFIPVFWSALGSQLRYCGNTVGGYDDVVVQGELEKPSWAAFYCNGDDVVAVASMMKDPVMVQCAELMRQGRMPKKSEIVGGVDVLEVGLPGEIVM
ncbi:hypothetical protein BDY21DRAFT_385394 [Lineolata rhizophorae]|uniref:Rieske domain-containing protein n=1 Tax=Lineolata rhizophorae TaxID=578093 RepID=A0A6A6P2X9_9PEZI|nr:hypothetical protein BDY21DRAFT_385394 [Lineolata rhizophorae]